MHDFTAALKERIRQTYKRVQNHFAAEQQKQKVCCMPKTLLLRWIVRSGFIVQSSTGPGRAHAFRVVKKLGDTT